MHRRGALLEIAPVVIVRGKVDIAPGAQELPETEWSRRRAPSPRPVWSISPRGRSGKVAVVFDPSQRPMIETLQGVPNPAAWVTGARQSRWKAFSCSEFPC